MADDDRPNAPTPPADPSPEARTKRGFSRRDLFRSGGAGLTAVAIVGLGSRVGIRRAHAQADGAQTPAASPAARRRSSEGLRRSDPHAFTERSVPDRRRTSPEVRILPIARAKFLVNARFDLRVEATGVDLGSARIEIHVSGPDGPAQVLHRDPERATAASGEVAVTFPQISYAAPGRYTVWAQVSSATGSASAEVEHEVVTARVADTPARNVIFFLGDGMGQPAITAARILSKGITEGKYDGLLELDQMQHRGLVGTSGVDSIATDSANSMSAFMTGHKSSVNAMGVYEGNDPDPNNHPRVENVTELLKRSREMAIGVVTTAEIQDATPAAVWAHTRRRSEYLEIMDQALLPEQAVDVLLGGGMASLLPQSDEDSRRDDDRDLRQEFRDLGYDYVSTRAELDQALDGRTPQRLLGTFHPGNLNVYLDRQHDPDPDVLGPWTDQPTLKEMTTAALAVLEQNDNGFFLMVEGASIDKMEHPLDGPRAVYDMIEMDQAIGLAKQWAADRDDTIVVVTADHNHSMSIVGTHDRRPAADPDRDANGVYGNAGFPTYADDDGDGFPDDPDPDVQLFFGWSNHPDHSDDFQHNHVFAQPALLDEDGRAVDNPDRDPDALVQIGNLPSDQTNCVHTVEDVPVFASGVGAARFNDFLDNTEVFFAVMDALGLQVPAAEPSEAGREAIDDEAEVAPIG